MHRGITKELNIDLEPLTGSIMVSSTPSGACVYLDGDYKRETPVLLSEVIVGQYTLKLTKSDYFDLIIRNVSVSVGETHQVHVNLTGYGCIDISSDPSVANVYLDGNYTGETPKKISNVAQGNHTLKLTKFGYFDLIIRNVSISVGRTSHLHENLTECGYINISSNPSGAKVYLDGDYMGETSKSISTVAQGNHTIKLIKSDYFDVIIRNVSVSVGETHYLHENLRAYGSLRISSYPSGAKVYLDDDYRQFQKNSDPESH